MVRILVRSCLKMNKMGCCNNSRQLMKYSGSQCLFCRGQQRWRGGKTLSRPTRDIRPLKASLRCNRTLQRAAQTTRHFTDCKTLHRHYKDTTRHYTGTKKTVQDSVWQECSVGKRLSAAAVVCLASGGHPIHQTKGQKAPTDPTIDQTIDINCFHNAQLRRHQLIIIL